MPVRRRWLLLLWLLVSTLAARAANPVLTIQGTGGSGGDVTAFVDNVRIVQVSTGTVVSGAVGNAGFESPNLGNGNFQYAPGGTAWSFTAQSGIAQNNSGFGAPTAPEGLQVAFVQQNSSLTQTLTLGAGTYYLTFRVAQRNCCTSGYDQSLNVYVGSTYLGNIRPANDGLYTTFTSGSFSVDQPNVTALSPLRNARTAALAANVGVTFSEPIDNTTAGTIRAFSAQAGGRKAGSYNTSSNTVTFDPTTNFRAGEKVSVSIPAAVRGTSGGAAIKQVYQFTTATATGLGFGSNNDMVVEGIPLSTIVGDVDGDGDLDLVTNNEHSSGSNLPHTLSIRLNNGTGSFSGGSDLTLGNSFNPDSPESPNSVTMGDFDGDGDLDLAAAYYINRVAVFFNNGNGSFGAASEFTTGQFLTGVLSGDVDGDGDLDLLAGAPGRTVRILLNNGSGGFSAGQDVSGAGINGMALGDIDSDGDLDLLFANSISASVVSVRLNDGTGTFSAGTDVTVSNGVKSVALGDLDGDQDLDLIAVNTSGNALNVRLNNGSGVFSGGSDPGVGAGPLDVAVGDVDGDGDLDLVSANESAASATVLLNNGAASFTVSSSPGFIYNPPSLSLADVNGDGVLDILTANTRFNRVSVRLGTPPAPTLTSFTPGSGTGGTSVTITGTTLSGASSVTFNGVAASSSVVNSGTSVTAVAPAGVTTGLLAVTTAGGTATSSVSFYAAPGNALAFDGVSSSISFNSTPAVNSLGPGGFTLEAWVYYDGNTAVNSIIRKTGDYNLYLSAGKLSAEVWPGGTGTTAQRGANGSVTVPANRWSHVAATWNGTSFLLYVNGVRDAGATSGTSTISGSENLRIGRSAIYGNPFKGRIDEVRIYSSALTAANIQADMTSLSAAVPANLRLYLNFDRGLAGGANTSVTTLTDLSTNAYVGTLNSFNLTSGNTASNWVESYALVVPTATAATGITNTGFTANWAAPTLGLVTNYVLDYSASATFASGVTTLTPAANATSQAISGLAGGTTYYYRLRADKTSVTGQGAYSGVGSATLLCPATAVVAQNVTVALNSSGSATVAATAVNNGSTVNCGLATAGSLSLSPSTFSCANVVPATVASSLSFNGSQYAEGTNANLPAGNAARTLEAWVYPTTAGANGVIFNYGTPTSNQRAGMLISGGNLYYVGENNDLRGATALTANAWNHVAATYDGTTLKLYVNGVLDGQLNPAAFNTTGTTWRIAQRSAPQTGEFLTGRVDEVRVWNVARSASQIASARAAGLPGSTAGLVAYYRLNEGTGTSTADASAANSTGTLFGSPSWLASGAPVVNGTPVTLTVTDAGGNTTTATAVVTVTDDLTPAAAGSGPLPVAPLLATSNVPEAGNYGILYQLDVPNAATFNFLGAVPYTVNNSGVSLARPSRVAYFMELQSGGVTKWVWASMDNFASNLTQLGMPNPTSNNVVWNQDVSNLTVFASSNAGLTTSAGLGTGRLEMWSTDYLTNNSGNVPGASASTYDFGDQQVASRDYGSFQVHNVAAGQTLFAYNNWGSNGDGGGIGDLGIGNQVGGSGQPDWTFANNANAYTVKRLYILVPNNGAFTQPATVALDAAGTATVTQGQVYTSAADNCAISSVVITPNTFTCAQVGTPQLVTVAVSDVAGNTATQSAFVTVTVPATPTTTWSGNTSSSWIDCANWSFGKVPDATTNVVIPGGLSRYPSLTTGTLTTKDLTIASNASLTTGAGATLQVNGNFTNNGAAALAGTIVFTGTAAQTVGGSSPGSFTHLQVDKTGGSLTLQQNAAVTGTLTLTNGILTTGAYDLTATGAVISETGASYVLGNVVSAMNLSAVGTRYAFGNLGLALTAAPGSTVVPGATTVRRVTGTALSGPGTSRSIKRYYDIQPTINAGLVMTVELGYLDAELNGITETDLGIFRSSTGTAGPWMPMSIASTSAAANTVTATGVEHFSVWTLGARSNPLPVTLVSFSAEAKGADVLLRWRTASELNNAYFEAEASTTGSVFQRVGRVEGQGTTTRPSEYSLTDANLARYGVPVVYYRLRQVDLNGTVTLSEVRPVQVPASANAALTVHPNPAHTATTVTGAAAGAEVKVFDAVGRLVVAMRADAAGQARLPLPNGLPTGVYLVRSGTQAQRLLVE